MKEEAVERIKADAEWIGQHSGLGHRKERHGTWIICDCGAKRQVLGHDPQRDEP